MVTNYQSPQFFIRILLLGILVIAIAIALPSVRVVTSEYQVNRIPDARNTYRLCLFDSTYSMQSVQIPLNFPTDELNTLPSISKYSVSIPFEGEVLVDMNRMHASICGVNESYFDIWGLIVTGQLPLGPGEILLSESLSVSLFSNKHLAVGKQLSLAVNDSVASFTIVGTYREETKLTYSPDIITSKKDAISFLYTDSSPPAYYAFAQGNPGYRIEMVIHANPNNVIEQVSELYQHKLSDKRPGFSLQPISSIYFGDNSYVYDNHKQGDPSLSRFIIVFIIFILVSTSFNLAIFFNGMAILKAKDYAVRKTLGASAPSLFAHSIKRSAISIVPSFILGVILSYIFSGRFLALINLTDVGFPGINWLFVSLVLVLLVSVIVVSGALSAIFLISVPPATALSGGKITTEFRQKFFLAIQFLQIVVFATAFLCVSGVKNQLNYIYSFGLTKDINKLFILDISEWSQSEIIQVSDYLNSNPSIASYSKVRATPPFQRGAFAPLPSLAKPDISIPFIVIPVGYNFAKTFGVDVVDGVDFSHKNRRQDEKGYVINETARRALGVESVVGEPWMDGVIIGVIDDFSPRTAKEETWPIVFNYSPEHTREVIFRMYNDSGISDITKSISTIISQGGIKIERHSDRIRQNYLAEYQLLNLINLTAVITLIIGVFGVISMISFTYTSQKRQFAVRKVLGATTASIVGLINRKLGKVFIAASLPAIGFSFFIVQHWVESFVYRASVSYVGIILFLLGLYLFLLCISCIQLWFFRRVDVVAVLKES